MKKSRKSGFFCINSRVLRFLYRFRVKKAPNKFARRKILAQKGKKVLTKPKRCAIITRSEKRTPKNANKKPAYLGVAQLVARYLGVVEAAGSSPVTQTKISSNFSAFVLNSSLFCLWKTNKNLDNYKVCIF